MESQPVQNRRGEFVLLENDYSGPSKPPRRSRSSTPEDALAERDRKPSLTNGPDLSLAAAPRPLPGEVLPSDVAYASQTSLEEDAGGFARDAFGRQSMSEKRHATLDAKGTDTYQRNKKLREERERQRIQGKLRKEWGPYTVITILIKLNYSWRGTGGGAGLMLILVNGYNVELNGIRALQESRDQETVHSLQRIPTQPTAETKYGDRRVLRRAGVSEIWWDDLWWPTPSSPSSMESKGEAKCVTSRLLCMWTLLFSFKYSLLS